MKKLFIGAVALSFAMFALSTVMPVHEPVRRTQASQPVQECPPPTSKGAYHVQGYDKETGEIVCGFTYFNECPYFAAAEAGTPECEKGKPTAEQLKPWKPAPEAQYGGK